MIAGFGAMLLVGASLGLLGGGGSILAVPVLVYGFGIAATRATGYSLLIVGTTSLAGAVANWRRGFVAHRVAAVFAIPSLASVYLTRAYLVPALPARIPILPGVAMDRDRLLMIGFAALMAVTAVAMIRGRNELLSPDQVEECRCKLLALEGLGVGFLAGLFGAGGGFLIIPALVLLARLPMRLAVGTSLTIISLQSLLGFVGVLQADESIDWRMLAEVTGIAVAGMGLGLKLSPRIHSRHLRAAFGWFILAIGIGIAARELVA